MRARLSNPILALLAALPLAVLGCQDYGFEELPSSVIKEKRTVVTVNVASEIDILFVIDNSGSMVGEQIQLAQSFAYLTGVLDERFGAGKYQMGVITTGIESEGCPACTTMITGSCMNDTGENGRFQDRVGRILSMNAPPVPPTFEFVADPNCRIVDSDNKSCFVDPAGGGLFGSGIVFVGTNGCGYEKGLEPVRIALSEPLVSTANGGFLRANATLAIVLVSDEEDCGKVGDVTENLAGYGGRVCYYAAKGVGPDGSQTDPTNKPYALTPVSQTYDFLMGLKNNRKGAVKFAAIVGMDDPSDPSSTTIRYESEDARAPILPSCYTPGCGTTEDCAAFPGTRYIELAELFGLGENGLVGTICQNDFGPLMGQIGEFISCPEFFNLSEPILDPALANILLNNVAVPRYSCSIQGRIEECTGPGDTTCSQGTCVETWSYTPPTDPPSPSARGGVITFADHYAPCDLITEGEIRFEVVYVTP
jgi:hypothetical protein